jgi:hypothetical protein
MGARSNWISVGRPSRTGVKLLFRSRGQTAFHGAGLLGGVVPRVADLSMTNVPPSRWFSALPAQWAPVNSASTLGELYQRRGELRKHPIGNN